MRCTFVLHGKRCRRQAASEAELCRYHLEWTNGSNEELARRGIETLIRALKLQAHLRQTDNSLDTVFERVLDTLGEEFPILKEP